MISQDKIKDMIITFITLIQDLVTGLTGPGRRPDPESI